MKAIFTDIVLDPSLNVNNMLVMIIGSSHTCIRHLHFLITFSTLIQDRPFFYTEYGGNDLDSSGANKQLTVEVALKLVDLCDTFKVRYSVFSIAVCQLLPRESLRIVEQDDYNSFVKCTNEQLRTELSTRRKLKGLKNSENNNYDDDVHDLRI